MVFDDSYMNQGTTTEWLNIVTLPENDFIRIYDINDLGGNNEGYYEKSSPKYYDYSFSYQLVKNNDEIYPIKVTTTGTKPNKDYSRATKADGLATYVFDKAKNKFVNKK